MILAPFLLEMENCMAEPIILDNTKRKTFCSCKRKYFLQHKNGLQPDYGSTAIRYGVAWHGFMEGYYSWVVENGWPQDLNSKIAALSQALELGKRKWDKECEKKTFIDDYKSFNAGVDAFNSYLEHFSQDKEYIKILSTETKFECPIEPESEAEETMMKGLPPLIFTGRIDLVVEMDYLNWLEDFKTTGWYLDKVISQTNRSPQFIGYSYAGRKILDYTIAGCLGSFHYIAASKSKKTGEFGDPRFDFRRVPQIYTDKDVISWRHSFIDTCLDIQRCEESGQWAESFDNCFQYGTCPYLRLCQQHVDFDQLNLDGFHVDFWDVLEEDGD